MDTGKLFPAGNGPCHVVLLWPKRPKGELRLCPGGLGDSGQLQRSGSDSVGCKQNQEQRLDVGYCFQNLRYVSRCGCRRCARCSLELCFAALGLGV